MKKKYQRVKEGVRLTLFWHDKKQKWVESKGKKYEAKKTIETPTGSRIVTERFRTMPEVNAWLQNSVNDFKPVSRGMLFKELKVAWREAASAHLFVTTLDNYESKLKHSEFFDDWPVNKIDSHAIDRWFVHLKRPEYLAGQKATRLNYREEYKVLRQVLIYYATRVDRDYRLPFLRDHAKMVHVRIKTETAEKDMSVEEQQRFAAHLKEDVWGTKYEAIYWIAQLQYSEAGRGQEIPPLEVEDIDFETGCVKRNKRLIWRKKGARERFIKEGLKNGTTQESFSEHSLSLIKQWMLRSGIRSGPLFHVKGAPPTYRMLQYRYDKALEKAGVRFRGMHLLRHAMASEHYDTGKDIRATQAKLGHKSLNSTMRYMRARSGARDRIQALIDEKLGTTQPAMKVGTSGNSVDFEGEEKAN